MLMRLATASAGASPLSWAACFCRASPKFVADSGLIGEAGEMIEVPFDFVQDVGELIRRKLVRALICDNLLGNAIGDAAAIGQDRAHGCSRWRGRCR